MGILNVLKGIAIKRLLFVRSASILLLAVPVVIAGCSDREAEAPVAGPTYCQNFDEIAVEKLAVSGDVDAMRKMRDYCFDCRVTPDGEEILRWAEMAAKNGDESDVKALSEIREFFLTTR